MRLIDRKGEANMVAQGQIPPACAVQNFRPELSKNYR